MAQSFNAISLSLGEAERERNGKPWSRNDYLEHQKSYNIDPDRTHLNEVLISANGKSERDIVNDFLESKMLDLNQKKIDQIQKWNQSHYGKTNPKTKKPYHKKSVDKRQMFPVGDYAGKGKRKLPYDIFKQSIEKGNARAKTGDTRFRTTVLQQFVVGIGNQDEWDNDPTRRQLMDLIHNDNNPKFQNDAKNVLMQTFFNPYLKQFQQENPSMHVVQAVVHFDESHPHLQFTVLPFRDGKESGGLGSTGYTTCLAHDHKNFHKSKIVDEFYQDQHEKIRDRIKLTGFRQNGKLSMMTLGQRPGSHKSLKVDQIKKFNNEKNRQLNSLKAREDKLSEDTKKFANDKKQLKNELVDSIKMVNPDHMVPREKLSNQNEKSEKISTEKGQQQHSAQSVPWLVSTLRKVLDSAKKEQKKLKKLWEQRAKDAYSTGLADGKKSAPKLRFKPSNEKSDTVSSVPPKQSKKFKTVHPKENDSLWASLDKSLNGTKEEKRKVQRDGPSRK